LLLVVASDSSGICRQSIDALLTEERAHVTGDLEVLSGLDHEHRRSGPIGRYGTVPAYPLVSGIVEPHSEVAETRTRVGAESR
jgi:hypothetical protein